MTKPDTSAIRLEIDTAGAYIYFNTGKVDRTYQLDDGVNVDIGEDGSIIGVEILATALESMLEESENQALPEQ